MLKRLVNFFSVIFILCVTFVFFSSCKSLPSAQKIEPAELLDNKNSLFLSIPPDCGRELIVKMIHSNVKDISHEKALKITHNINTVYAGFNKKNLKTEFQISTFYPAAKAAATQIFSKKNGWNLRAVKFENSLGKEIPYNIYESYISASVLPNGILCLGRNLDNMIETYHNISEKKIISSLNPDVSEWLSQNDGTIRFYAVRPQSFLSSIIGAVLNFKLLYVRGKMILDTQSAKHYLMDIEFEFLDKRILPAAKGILEVALGFQGIDIYSETETHLKISNIKVDKEHLYKVLEMQ